MLLSKLVFLLGARFHYTCSVAHNPNTARLGVFLVGLSTFQSNTVISLLLRYHVELQQACMGRMLWALHSEQRALTTKHKLSSCCRKSVLLIPLSFLVHMHFAYTQLPSYTSAEVLEATRRDHGCRPLHVRAARHVLLPL